MNLQEQISRIQEMMGVLTENTKSTNKEFNTYKDFKFNTLRNYTLQDIVDNWESLSDHKNENIKTIKYFVNNPDEITDLVYDEKGLEDGYHRLIAAKILKKPRFKYKLAKNINESMKWLKEQFPENKDEEEVGQDEENFPYKEKKYSEDSKSDFSNSKVKDIVWRAGNINLNPKSGGLWFAETKDDVEKFAWSVKNEKREGVPYHINLQNPFYYDSFWHGYINDVKYGPNRREQLMYKLIKQGYDGIIIDTDTWNSTGDEYSVTSKQYIVFNPENVKPA